jgi:uncharacterized protein (DUF2141 family)
MKRIVLLAAAGMLAALAVGVTCNVAESPPLTDVMIHSGADGHDLTVTVTDIKRKDGQIIIALFMSEEGFPGEIDKAAKIATVALDNPVHTFEKLPAGKYVVVTVHDRNNNGKVDTSLLGLPQEPIGLSNHPTIRPPRNMPNFHHAKVDVSKETKIEVNLVEIGL